MAEFRTKGLFEAMKAAKGPAQRPAGPVGIKLPMPPATTSGPRLGEARGGAGQKLGQALTSRRVLAVSVVVVAAIVVIWVGKTVLSRYESWAASREKPNIAVVASPPVEERVAAQPAPMIPVAPAAPEAPSEPTSLPDGHHGGLLPQTGEMPAIWSSTGGSFRIQIFSAPVRNHDEMEKERRKLATAGVETVVEHRGNWNYVFTSATFATVDGAETVEALKKIRALGYGSAYATRKQTGNR